MLPVIAYIRVSTKQQALNGTSLDGQKLQIGVYAKHRELRVMRWFKDDSSARNEEEGSERRGFKAACGLALKKGWPILVVDASRFSRTEESYNRFISAGGKVYDLSGFGADEAEMAAKIARAKFDGDKRSKATRKGQDEAKAAGKKFGTPRPENGAKASAVSRGRDGDIRKRELERLRDQATREGATGPKEFADWLNRKGHLTAQGAPWTAGNVRRVLRGGNSVKGVSKPSIPTGETLSDQAEDKISLTADEMGAVRELILVARWDEAARSQAVDLLSLPIPRSMRDRLVAKAQALRDLRAAKKRAELAENVERNPDYGIFS